MKLGCVVTLEVKEPENTSISAYLCVCVNDSTHIPCKLASLLNSAQFTAKLVAPCFIPNTVMVASCYFRIRVFRPSLFEDVYLLFSSFSPFFMLCEMQLFYASEKNSNATQITY